MNYSPGLEGVIAGETGISNVEGTIGRLSYRGLPIDEIVELDYLDVMNLVLFDILPGEGSTDALRDFLAAHGRLTPEETALVAGMPLHLHPMAMLQAMIPALNLSGDRYANEDALTSEGLEVIARLPALVAEIARHRGSAGGSHIFDESDDVLAGYLTMMTGRTPAARDVEVFRILQLLQMEHSFNAGTFTARVIGSTLASAPAVLSGAVGALSGVLHGSADQAALAAAREVGSPEGAEVFVDELLARKGRLMGMGHREYRTVDPRSAIIRPMAEELSRGTAFENDFNTLRAIETVFNKRMRDRGKEVWANLEFYKGVVYEALGIGPDYFTATFALSRSVGWLAHLVESRKNNRIIRPAAHYTGRSVSDSAKPAAVVHEMA